jgi:hypothetical protein
MDCCSVSVNLCIQHNKILSHMQPPHVPRTPAAAVTVAPPAAVLPALLPSVHPAQPDGQHANALQPAGTQQKSESGSNAHQHISNGMFCNCLATPQQVQATLPCKDVLGGEAYHSCMSLQLLLHAMHTVAAAAATVSSGPNCAVAALNAFCCCADASLHAVAVVAW